MIFTLYTALKLLLLIWRSSEFYIKHQLNFKYYLDKRSVPKATSYKKRRS